MSGVDEVFGALASRRRRLALHNLQQHRTLTLPDLAELVAEQEKGEDLTDLTGERIKLVYMSLYHHHIPVLERAGLARYEQEPDLVKPTETVSEALETASETLQKLQHV